LGVGGGEEETHHRRSSMTVRSVQEGALVWDSSVGRGGQRSDREGGRSSGGAHGGNSGPDEGRTAAVHVELHTGMKWPGG
jgi:hypothetical protein